MPNPAFYKSPRVDGMLALLNQPRCLPVPGFVVGDGSFVCGRSVRCDLIVPHPTISRRHAELRVSGGHVEVRDLRSRNGMFVDGRRVEIAERALGQAFRLGQVSFVIAQADGQELDCGSSLDTASTHALAIATEQGQGVGLNELSAAQRRVLDLALAGLVEKQIAHRLNISRHTAHNHLRSIYRTLGVHSRAELLARLLSR